MSRINEYKRSWRLAFLLLLVVAISGPWFFDVSWVPASYTCSPPHIRLDEIFCGRPQSMTWFFSLFIGEFKYLVTGALSFTDTARLSLIFLFLFLLLLPLWSTAILLRRGSGRRWHILHRVGLGLAAGIGGFIGSLDFSSASWLLWGLWLYVTLCISALALEVLMGKRWQI